MVTKISRTSTTAKSPAKGRTASRPVVSPAAEPAASATPATKPKARRAPVPKVSPEARYKMIADAAYYRAQQRGFSPQGELDDWIAAEQEIDRLLASPKPRGRSAGKAS